ncbi:MAG TPA: DUF4476 domain-containing protein [Puia sp.]|jgi:hypothetical protein|nr:DUF4476 domain-containing protein [Puia sp.]
MHKPGLFGMNGFMVFLLIFFTVAAHAQQPGYLILIEAENKQAFTVRIGEQFYASSSQGHLVLSRLKDSSYRLKFRFPKNNLPEQVFPVVIHHKDLGFQLKGADSTWVLYNWQTKETIRPVYEFDSSRILDRGVKREDGFSRLMAAVVDDSSVMYNTYTGNGFKQDSSVVKTRGTAVDSGKLTASRQPSSVIRQHPSINPGIKKLREVTLKISRKIVYEDIGKDGQKDTITLFVFFETSDTLLKKPGAGPALATAKPVKSTDSSVLNKVQAMNNTAIKSGEPGCTQMATEGDLAFLRNAILKANTEMDKISIASEAFEIKCFTVSQIRLLASLFVSDKDKYKLMDAAHQHISDRDHFHELVDMLTDKNFQRKFLLMADKRS